MNKAEKEENKGHCQPALCFVVSRITETSSWFGED